MRVSKTKKIVDGASLGQVTSKPIPRCQVVDSALGLSLLPPPSWMPSIVLVIVQSLFVMVTSSLRPRESLWLLIQGIFPGNSGQSPRTLKGLLGPSACPGVRG